MRLPSPWIVVLMLCWPTTAKAAPPQSVPEGAGFPVQRLIEAAPSSSIPQSAIAPSTMPEGASFQSGDIIGLPIVAMPKAPATGVAGDGEELLRWVPAGDVLFDFDESEIRTDGEQDLEAFLDRLNDLEGFRLTVEGHTDSKGTDAYNQDLSQRRADAVAAWLTVASPGLPRPETRAYGETHPAAANEKPDGSDDPAGRQLNRRVEIIVRAATAG
jgi:hypothetical protein